MKYRVFIFSVMAIAALFSVSAQGKKGSAPGLADTFYRGVTTIAVADETSTITETTVLSSTVETRLIGGGQANSGKDGNLQDRTVSVVQTEVYELRVVTYEQHRGVAHSNGKYLGTVTEETKTLVSSELVTQVGDWGAAYDLPSGQR